VRIGALVLSLALAVLAGTTAARAQAPISDPGAFRPLTVGSDLTYPPFAFRQPDGKIAGFSVDFAWEIAKRLGRPGVEVIETPVAGLFGGLNAKRYEFIVAPIAVTAERAQQMLFAEPYMSQGYAVIVPAGEAELKSLDELKGKAVAVTKGGAAEAWADDAAGKAGFSMQKMDRLAEVIQAVTDRKVAAGVGDLALMLRALTQNKQAKVGFSVLSGRVLAFAFRQDDSAFRNRVELIVEEMKRDGTLAGMYQGWFGARPPEGSVMLSVDEAGYGAPGFAGHGPK
jgi:polar amino acid transport system substrate-binding protein